MHLIVKLAAECTGGFKQALCARARVLQLVVLAMRMAYISLSASASCSHERIRGAPDPYDPTITLTWTQ